MMKSLTEEEQSQSYFFIFIVVGVATIIGVSFLIIKYQMDAHIKEYHSEQSQQHAVSFADREKEVEMDQNDTIITPSEESVEDIFDDGDVFEDTDMNIIDHTDDLDEIQVDDISL